MIENSCVKSSKWDVQVFQWVAASLVSANETKLSFCKHVHVFVRGENSWSMFQSNVEAPFGRNIFEFVNGDQQCKHTVKCFVVYDRFNSQWERDILNRFSLFCRLLKSCYTPETRITGNLLMSHTQTFLRVLMPYPLCLCPNKWERNIFSLFFSRDNRNTFHFR